MRTIWPPALRLRIAGKVIALTAALAAAVATLFAVTHHLRVQELLEQRNNEKLIGNTKMLTVAIQAEFNRLSEDVLLLSKAPGVTFLLTEVNHPEHYAAEQDYSGVAAGRVRTIVTILADTRNYLRLSIYSTDEFEGEIFRTELSGESYVTYEEADLPSGIPQEIAEIKNQLAPGKISYSYVDSKEIAGGSPAVSQSAFRAVTPAIDADGHDAGLIVIEKAYKPTLDAAVDYMQPDWDSVIFDAAGNMHTYPVGSIAGEGGARGQVYATIRELVSDGPGSDSLHNVTVDGRDYAVNFVDVELRDSATPQVFRVATIADHEVLYADLAATNRNNILLTVLLVLVASLFGLVLGRRFVRPLQAMNETILEQGTDGDLSALPVHRADEIGDFARSYCTIARELNGALEDLGQGNVDLQETNAKLVHANKEVRDLAAIISHDLRAPLINILGFSDELTRLHGELSGYLATMNVDLDESEIADLLQKRLPTALKFIADSSSRMESKLDTILHLSRLGRYEMKPVPIDLGKLFRTVIESHVTEHNPADVSIELDSAPPVIIDEEAASIIANNLVSNAVKYRDGDRPLSIRIRAVTDEFGLTLCVEDNGRGINVADQDLIFGLFRRFGRQDTSGEGIGLSFCKALVSRLNGKIWCNSIAGEGSSFFVFFPIELLGRETVAA